MPKPISTKEPIEAWLLLFAAILAVLAGLSSNATANPTGEAEIQRVERAVVHVAKHGIPKHNVMPWPKHPLVRDAERRREFAEAVVFAGAEKRIDHFFLTAIGFREGSFLMEGVGTRDEVTAFQIVPDTLKFARKLDPRCNPSSYRGAAICAASLLRYGLDERCPGNMEGAFLWYATGRKICRPDRRKLVWLVNDRFGIAKHLESL